MATKKEQKKAVPVKGKKNKKSSGTALKVAGGVLAGAAAGALAGVLLAPQSGKKTRKLIVDRSKKTATDVRNKVTGKVKKLAAKVNPVKKNVSKKGDK